MSTEGVLREYCGSTVRVLREPKIFQSKCTLSSEILAAARLQPVGVLVAQVWCRVLSWLKLYLTSTSYCWMFCEGYYLHRLIANAFEPPKNLLALYAIGWGMSGWGTGWGRYRVR